MESRLVRRKQVRVACELIQQLITTDADSAAHEWGARCIEGVPPRARLVQAYFDGTALSASAAMLTLVFEDEAWPLVPVHDIPVLVPRFEEYRRPVPPSTASLAGSDPSFTGDMSTEEDIRSIRGV